MGLFSLTIAGAGFIIIGACESLTLSTQTSQNPIPSSPPDQTPKPISKPAPKTQPLSFFTSTVTLIFSFLFIINSLISFFSGISSQDRVGSALQLQILAVACLFLFYSILCLLSKVSTFSRFPSQILNLVLLCGFVEEFLLFYSQRKDTSGIENRYFDLMLVPILICVVSTLLELKSAPRSNLYARLGRGVGLVLQGTWFVQMGISFYTDMIVYGCTLHEKSRGNYTIKCKGHPEYHRARGIATLQFNCHLALIVVFVMSVYSIMAKDNANLDRDHNVFMNYKPIGAEMQQMENLERFTLDSDEDNEIKEEHHAAKENGGVVQIQVEKGVNGNVSHQ